MRDKHANSLCRAFHKTPSAFELGEISLTLDVGK